MEVLKIYEIFDNKKPIHIMFLGNGKYYFGGFYYFLEPQGELSKTKYVINRCQEHCISSLSLNEAKESSVQLYLYICIGEKDNLVSEFTTGKLFISKFPYQELSKNLRIKGSDTVIQKKNIIPVTKDNMKLVFEYNKHLSSFRYLFNGYCKISNLRTITADSLELNICIIHHPLIIKDYSWRHLTSRMKSLYLNIADLLDSKNYKRLNKNMRYLCSNAIKMNELPEKLSEPIRKWALDNL